MGKNSEKLPKEKIRARFQKYSCFVFSLPTADETPGAFKKQFGRERPGEQVWAAKPHKHPGRSRPNQGFLPRSLFQRHLPQVCCSTEICGGTQVNGTPIFRGEHCVCSCVHPCPAQRRTRGVSFDQNTACVSVFSSTRPRGSSTLRPPSSSAMELSEAVRQDPTTGKTDHSSISG